MRTRRVELYICIVLVVGILAVYGQVWNHDFINYDDTQYVTENPWVQGGLAMENISRAFTATEAYNWHPLTWLSHMADCHLFGLHPGAHHLTSLLFHIFNTLLLFAVFRMMTGDLWSSAFVAALFAFHPLHVESVAWVAERKDVLSAFFWLLTMWSYVRYTRRPGIGRYLPVVLFFALGLMSKPMVVTLPFVLLLLDIWPLGRLRREGVRGQWFRLVWEKIPLLLLSGASSVVTFFVQRGGGAVSSLDAIPLDARAANALLSYISYLVKTIWPYKLAVFYPYPRAVSLVQGLMAGVLLVVISYLVIRAIKRHPYLAVGWLWYLGTLVPVIGLVQVGSQSMADRYTYLPLVGIFVMISWGIPAFFSRWRLPRCGLAVAGSSVLAVLMAVTWVQAGYWKDNISLFRHALDVTTHNYLAHNNLGIALHEQGDTGKAIEQYREVLRIVPRFAKGHVNLGNAFARQGDTTKAVEQYREALRINPDISKAHHNLGVILLQQGDIDGAFLHFRQVLRLDPQNAMALNNIGGILETRGGLEGAADRYTEALVIDPDNPEARANLSRVLVRVGNLSLASRCYGEVLKSAHESIGLRMSFGVVLSRLGNLAGAVRQFREAVRIDPEDGSARYNLGLALSRQGKMDEAVAEYRASLEIDSGNHKARYNLALALYIMGEYAGAITGFEEVMRREPALEARVSYDIARTHAREGRGEESAEWLKRAVDAGFDDWDRIRTDTDLDDIRGTTRYKSIIEGR